MLSQWTRLSQWISKLQTPTAFSEIGSKVQKKEKEKRTSLIKKHLKKKLKSTKTPVTSGIKRKFLYEETGPTPLETINNVAVISYFYY